MIKIHFEEYWALDGQFCLFDGQGDYIQPASDTSKMGIKTRRKTRTFSDPHSFIKWNAEHMESGWHSSRPEVLGVIIGPTGINPIALQWACDNTHGILVHEVEDTRRGILFSDGAYTKGAEYESDEFKGLIQECRQAAGECSGLKLCEKTRSFTYGEVIEKDKKEKELNGIEWKVIITAGRSKNRRISLEETTSYIMDRDLSTSGSKIAEAVTRLTELGIMHRYKSGTGKDLFGLTFTGTRLYEEKTGEKPYKCGTCEDMRSRIREEAYAHE